MKRASIIISFYNNPKALKLILAALQMQSEKDFEAIIADDGSKKEVVNEIDSIKKNYSFPVKHLWHEDQGFRKNRILNQAVLAAESNYLIFIDGDCIPHRHFIHDHLHFSRKNRIVAGRRVNLSEKLSKSLTPENILKGKLNRWLPSLLMESFGGKARYVEKAIYLPFESINKALGSTKKGVLGCNFSVHKDGLYAINGFDMRYEMPCVGEDVDPEYRLKLLGYDVFTPKFRLIQYHLFHLRQSRDGEKINFEIFNETRKHQISRCDVGLDQLQA
ncbi:glycosyltransferase [Marivirga sp. S37H4]|uniref:Glycosyltransferase n=1 Tax=Marivirga aurantiaca TaxID=2802615 RepID=A0A934X1D6_9BACT|nr:glycosyltransferase [Marivirga aurantiaca]MBK6267183.1 glycosyltransferase [Marivirga aurantiaca]